MSKGCLIVLVVFISLLLLGGMYIYRIFHNGELANKPFYVALQSFAERSEYNPPITISKEIAPIFVRQGIKYKSRYFDLLGIATKDEQSPYFWIVTNTHENAEPPDYVFSINAGAQFYLYCSYLDKLEKAEKIDIVVRNFLKRHCIKDE